MTEPSGYVLEPLREGPDFTLYCGWQHGNQSPVLVVALTTKQPSPHRASSGSSTNTRSQPNSMRRWPLASGAHSSRRADGSHIEGPRR
jgi:hypothetical protein